MGKVLSDTFCHFYQQSSLPFPQVSTIRTIDNLYAFYVSAAKYYVTGLTEPGVLNQTYVLALWNDQTNAGTSRVATCANCSGWVGMQS